MWLFAVIAMLCWSGSDIFSKIGSPQREKTSHFKVGIAVGGIMGLHALYMIFIEKIPFSLMDIVYYLPASFFYIVSMVVGYIGLRYIELSISSPICNGSGAVSAILCMILFGITFNPESESNAVYLNGWIIAGLVLVEVAIMFPFSTMLYKGYVASLPREIDEAAIVDGCGPWRLFFRVEWALLKPITATVVILRSTVVYNDFINPMYFLTGSKSSTVQLCIYTFQSAFSTDWGHLFAAIVIVCLPPVLLFLLLNKKIMEGVTMGAVKG